MFALRVLQKNSSQTGEREFRHLQKHLRGGEGRGLGCEMLLVWVTLLRCGSDGTKG